MLGGHGGTVRTGDYIFPMEKKTKLVNWEQNFLYITEYYQQLGEYSLLVTLIDRRWHLSMLDVRSFRAAERDTDRCLSRWNYWQVEIRESLLSLGLPVCFPKNIKVTVHTTIILPVVLMGVKLGRSHWGRNALWGCLRVGWWGEYLGLRGAR